MSDDLNYDALDELSNDCSCFNGCNGRCNPPEPSSPLMGQLFGVPVFLLSPSHLRLSQKCFQHVSRPGTGHQCRDIAVWLIDTEEADDVYLPLEMAKSPEVNHDRYYWIDDHVPGCTGSYQARALLRENVHPRCIISWPYWNSWKEWRLQSIERLEEHVGMQEEDAHFVTRCIELAAYRADSGVLVALAEAISRLENLHLEAEERAKCLAHLAEHICYQWEDLCGEVGQRKSWRPILVVLNDIFARTRKRLDSYAQTSDAKIVWDLVEQSSSEPQPMEGA